MFWPGVFCCLSVCVCSLRACKSLCRQGVQARIQVRNLLGCEQRGAFWRGVASRPQCRWLSDRRRREIPRTVWDVFNLRLPEGRFGALWDLLA